MPRLTNEQLQDFANRETENAGIQAALIELIQRRNLEASMTEGNGIDDIARKFQAAVNKAHDYQSDLISDKLEVQVFVTLPDLVAEATVALEDRNGVEGYRGYQDLGITITDLNAAVFALATVRGQLTHVTNEIVKMQVEAETHG